MAATIHSRPTRSGPHVGRLAGGEVEPMDERSRPDSRREAEGLEPRLPRWLRPGTEHGLADTLALFLSLRVLLGLVALYVWWAGMTPAPCHFEVARNGWLT